MRISDWSSDVCSSDLFRYDDRNNNTPIDIFNMIGGDSQLQNPADISDRRRLNQPYSYGETKYGLNAGYRLDDGTRFTAVAQRRRSEEHTSELQSLMRISYAVFCLKKKTKTYRNPNT